MKQSTTEPRPCRRLPDGVVSWAVKRFVITLAVLLAASLGACGGDQDGDDASEPTAPVGSDANEEDETTPALPCNDLYARPADQAVEVLEEIGCIDFESDATEASLYDVESLECDDGSTLYWNELGWGSSEGGWQRHSGTLEEPPEENLAACSA